MELEPEQCVPWEPVPARANRYMTMNVALFEESGPFAPMRDPVSLVLVASLDDGPPETHSALAWRVTLETVAGFHMLPFECWAGAFPHEFADDGQRLPLRVATWEVINSRWLANQLTPLGRLVRPRLRPLHHFIVASSYSIYEIAAESWQVQALGPWKGVRQRLEARWEQEHLAAP